ncbi:pirin family protein [Brevibacillus fluminis]|uniref:pirin family protein n=1 Tax=Brevibacillus fluminis TaxID=511487 RepID=UPI003F894FD1
MIRIYPAESRFAADHGWLKSKFSFSFAEYYDPNNQLFGPLRVFNDDIVQPGYGFGAHPHREMEIVSVVLKGELGHEDSTGNKEVIRPGEIQRMSAGTGIVHSEMNPSQTEEVNFLQLWFLPAEKGLTPSYEQKAYDMSKRKNNLLPVVSGKALKEDVVHIHQDLTMYLSDLEANHTITFEQAQDRYTYVFVMEGTLRVNGEAVLNRRDAARITDITKLQIETAEGASFMLIDLPSA